MKHRQFKNILGAALACALVAVTLAITGCGGQQATSSTEASASASATAASASASAASSASAESGSTAVSAASASYTIDYGSSQLYQQADIDAAVEAVMAEFGTWKGATMKSIAFTDDATCEADVAYCNELRPEGDAEYDQAIVVVSTFHSPSGKDAEGTAWEPDTDYEGYTWHLGRTGDGPWKLLTWGYA